MARTYEIGWAFRDAIKLDICSRQIVTTNEFRLAYILRYQSNFFEIDAAEENKTWVLRNMGYVM